MTEYDSSDDDFGVHLHGDNLAIAIDDFHFLLSFAFSIVVAAAGTPASISSTTPFFLPPSCLLEIERLESFVSFFSSIRSGIMLR